MQFGGGWSAEALITAVQSWDVSRAVLMCYVERANSIRILATFTTFGKLAPKMALGANFRMSLIDTAVSERVRVINLLLRD